jgi:hypothetical protein
VTYSFQYLQPPWKIKIIEINRYLSYNLHLQALLFMLNFPDGVLQSKIIIKQLTVLLAVPPDTVHTVHMGTTSNKDFWF